MTKLLAAALTAAIVICGNETRAEAPTIPPIGWALLDLQDRLQGKEPTRDYGRTSETWRAQYHAAYRSLLGLWIAGYQQASNRCLKSVEEAGQ